MIKNDEKEKVMRDPSQSFERRGGLDQQTALFNRVAAIKRIEFLCGTNLASESSDFKKLVDAEMYAGFYKDYPTDHLIDEEFCQRCATIVRNLKDKKTEELALMEEGADERIKVLYNEYVTQPSIPVEIEEEELKPELPQELNKIAPPEKISLLKRILKWISKK